MMDAAVLPHVNATLNGITAALLITAWRLIRRKRVAAHRRTMLAAVGTSALFMISYLVYHVQVGSRPFPGQGWPRALYFSVLTSHTVLAAAIVPLVFVTLARGLKLRVAAHRRIARWALPLWLYVSVTGVIVYWMLYRTKW